MAPERLSDANVLHGKLTPVPFVVGRLKPLVTPSIGLPNGGVVPTWDDFNRPLSSTMRRAESSGMAWGRSGFPGRPDPEAGCEAAPLGAALTGTCTTNGLRC
jgi:hypothetical protein